MSPQQEAIERAIIDTERAGEEYAKAARTESALQAGRHGAKQEAIKRLMEWENKPNDRDGEKAPRATSVSAAEKLVETDPGYAAYLAAEREATFDKNMAYSRMIVARLRALALITDKTAASGPPADIVLDLDAVRNRDDDRERLVGGVPR